MHDYLTIKNLNKTYSSSNGDVPALVDINLNIRKGEFIGIIGKSGAGKSTLINMISGTDTITSGELWLDGIPIHLSSQQQLIKIRGKNIGVIYQSFELLNQMSILENVVLPIDLCGAYSPLTSRKKAMEMLELVEIGDHANKPPVMVSGGQRQRVAIARALANDPALIAADEPTGSLDSLTSETIMTVFRNLVSKGRTVVMVTHEEDLAGCFDHVIALQEGKIVGERRRRQYV